MADRKVENQRAAGKRRRPTAPKMIWGARLSDAYEVELMAVLEEASFDHIKHQWCADGWPAKMVRDQARAAGLLFVKWMTAQRGV